MQSLPQLIPVPVIVPPAVGFLTTVNAYVGLLSAHVASVPLGVPVPKHSHRYCVAESAISFNVPVMHALIPKPQTPFTVVGAFIMSLSPSIAIFVPPSKLAIPVNGFVPDSSGGGVAL